MVAEIAKQVSSRSRRPFPPLKLVVMGTGRRGGGAIQSWVKPTEAAGAAEEAHRRWPEGRSEQGQRLTLQKSTRCRANRKTGRVSVLAWPKLQPRSGVRWSLRLRSRCLSRSRRPFPPLKRVVMGTGRRAGGAVQFWVKPTEAPGEAEEAHRRWPEGRSEQGREQGKG